MICEKLYQLLNPLKDIVTGVLNLNKYLLNRKPLLSVFNAIMLQECLKIFKILTFLKSIKSTIYPLYFQKPCRVYTKNLFSVGQVTHTTMLFFSIWQRDWGVSRCRGDNNYLHYFDYFALFAKFQFALLRITLHYLHLLRVIWDTALLMFSGC